jgi:transposase-like protein
LWADLLRDCKRRGTTAPVLAVGDGALGFWKAVREVFPATGEQRCGFRKQANDIAALMKSAHPAALAAIKDIYNAEDIGKARVAVKAFEVDFGAKYPRAVAKIVLSEPKSYNYIAVASETTAVPETSLSRSPSNGLWWARRGDGPG